MSKGVNRATLLGHVGQDPEVRTTGNGAKVAKFSLATSEKWKGADGSSRESTQWHRVTVFGKLADIVEQYVSKGDRLYVEGRIEYSDSEGNDGVKRYWTDIIAQELVMLGSGKGEERGSRDEESQREEPTPAPRSLSEPDDALPF